MNELLLSLQCDNALAQYGPLLNQWLRYGLLIYFNVWEKTACR